MEEDRVAEALPVSVHPHAIALILWILAFIDSAAAFVDFSTTALRMPSRCFRTIRAAGTYRAHG